MDTKSNLTDHPTERLDSTEPAKNPGKTGCQVLVYPADWCWAAVAGAAGRAVVCRLTIGRTTAG